MTSSSVRRVLDAVARALEAAAVSRREAVLVAVSGGVDSVCLLRLLVEVGQPVVVATIDHGLRPSSRADTDWVIGLAASLGLEAERVAVRVEAGNVQAQARRARYAALGGVARRRKLRVVATGHTATDQAETVLMALARGAGLRGLAGMAPRRALTDGVDLVRPLLQTSRSDLEAVARDQGWAWREDPTNATDAFQRNRIRHSVLPDLRDEGGDRVDLRLASSAASARSALEALRVGLEDAFDGTLLRVAPDDARAAVWIVEALAAVAPDAVRTQAWIDRVTRLLEADVGQRVDAGGVVVWREPDGLRFERAADPVLEGALEVVLLPAVPTPLSNPDPHVEIVDADRARDPVVRLWRDGDRIRPLGLEGSVLVSDLLRGRGVPAARRRRVAVVCVEGEVVWVVGHRLGAVVAVSDRTARAERWTWRPHTG